jgi:hypothetical protein
MADFRQKYGDECEVEAHLSDSVPYSLVTRQELDKTFKRGPGGWNRFYKQHPRAAGYWDFSRPGYNPSEDEAVLYVGHYCGGLCGTGHLYLLRKSDGKWRVVGRSMLWIS